MNINIAKKIKTKIPPTIMFMFAGFFLIVLLAFLSPVFFQDDLGSTNLKQRLEKPSFMEGGSKTYLLGTDHLGRDFIARLFYGTKSTVEIAFSGMIIASVLGTFLGVISGLKKGIVDNIVMFLVDTRLSIPFIIIALICSSVFGSEKYILILILGFAGWSSFTRLVRGQVIQMKDQMFIESSRTLGASETRIVFEHILPNIASPLIVHATLRLSHFILLESSISFLGLGIQPPEISLGLLVSHGRDYLINSWWLAIYPSIIILALVLQVSLIGDWLRDVLDPKLKNTI